MLEQEDKIDIFKGVIAMKCLRNPTKRVKFALLGTILTAFPPHCSPESGPGNNSRKGVSVTKLSLRSELLGTSTKNWHITCIAKNISIYGQLLCLLSYASSVVVQKIGCVNEHSAN